jgi:hypothetical protein
MSMFFAWVVTLCVLEVKYKPLEKYTLQPCIWRQCVPLKRWYLPTSRYRITRQKNKTWLSLLL